MYRRGNINYITKDIDKIISMNIKKNVVNMHTETGSRHFVKQLSMS